MVKKLKRVIYRTDAINSRSKTMSYSMVISYFDKLWDVDRSFEENQKDTMLRRANHLGRKHGKSMIIEKRQRIPKNIRKKGYYPWYVLYYPVERKPRKGANYAKI